MTFLVPYFVLFAAIAEPGGFYHGDIAPVIETQYTFGVMLFETLGLEASAKGTDPIDGYNLFNQQYVDFSVDVYVEIKMIKIGYYHSWMDGPYPQGDYVPRMTRGAYDSFYIEFDTRLIDGCK